MYVTKCMITHTQLIESIESYYGPCDNYSANTVTREYEQCVEYIEGLLSTTDCNKFICCGDYNTSFKQGNAQCRFLQDIEIA